MADKRLRNLDGNKLKEHLEKFKKILDDSTVNSPYLHRPRDINFDSPKIVAPQRSPKILLVIMKYHGMLVLMYIL